MKLKLTLRNGSLEGKMFELTVGFFTFGRSEKCNIRFDKNERIVSLNHAYIQSHGEKFWLTDNMSTYGTFVNGLKIEKVILKSGDRILFGKKGIEAVVEITLHTL